MDAAPVYFWISDGCAWIRVAGPGTRFNAGAVKDFARDAISRGLRAVVVDLKECPEMDSTFMGMLAFVALRLRELGSSSIRITHANETTVKSLQHLGLDQLFDISEGE